MHDKSFQSCPALCDPMDCSPSGSSVYGILPGKNTGVDLPDSGIEPASLMSPKLADSFFITSTTWKACNNRILKLKDNLGTQQIP